MNIEQIKQAVLEVINTQLNPVSPRGRGRYTFWINPVTKQIGCGWSTALRLQPYHRIVYTCIFTPGQGFTSDQWEDIANCYKPYLET
jgi:hypothetical protein